jgi:hypothetical protein
VRWNQLEFRQHAPTRTGHCFPPPLWTLGILAAFGRVEHLKPVDLVIGRSCEEPSAPSTRSRLRCVCRPSRKRTSPRLIPNDTVGDTSGRSQSCEGVSALVSSGPAGQRHVARGPRRNQPCQPVVDTATTDQPAGPRESEPETLRLALPVTPPYRIRCTVTRQRVFRDESSGPAEPVYRPGR